MTEKINHFYEKIPDRDKLTVGQKVEYFLYYLTVAEGSQSASAKQIKDCFELCDLKFPSNTQEYLSRGVRAKPQRILRPKQGEYKLERSRKEEIAKTLNVSKLKSQTNDTLRSLEGSLKNLNEKSFYNEAMNCYEVSANRATIMMIWILTISHMYEYILTQKLSEFNSVLSKNTDKRVKVTKVTQRDDFSDIPEGKFIEFCRSAKIISNDVRKILVQNLETRNSSVKPPLFEPILGS